MKYGVIDIGTRATRLLMGDTDDLVANGFQFSDYRNLGTLTEAGRGLRPVDGGQWEMRTADLDRTIRYLTHLVRTCLNEGIPGDRIVAVGTEVFRRIRNQEEVVDLIERSCGLRVQVLAAEEEAECTFWAAMVSCREYVEPGQPFAVIEQGGGSTQITVAELDDLARPTRHGQVSIPELGTVLLRRRFLDLQANRSVGDASEAILAFAHERIEATLTGEFPREKMPAAAFALGKVITDYCQGSNWQVHGRMVTRRELEESLDPGGIMGRYQEQTINQLLEAAENGAIRESVGDIEKALERFYGLPCYAAILDCFELTNLRVCGAGLRYGVFFRLARGEWDDVREHELG